MTRAATWAGPVIMPAKTACADVAPKASTYCGGCARIIGSRIFLPAAPVLDITPSLERNIFLRDAVDVVQAAEETEVALS